MFKFLEKPVPTATVLVLFAVMAFLAAFALGPARAQVKLATDKGPSVAATPAPSSQTPSVEQLMADCRKYFGDRRYITTIQSNLFYKESHERHYNFGTGADTAPKLTEGKCAVGYNWVQPGKGWFRWVEARFDGVKLSAGDKRWEWAEFTPQQDGTLLQDGTYERRENGRAVYHRHETRVLKPVR